MSPPCASGVTALGDMLSVGRVWADRDVVIERRMTLISTKLLMKTILAVSEMVRRNGFDKGVFWPCGKVKAGDKPACLTS